MRTTQSFLLKSECIELAIKSTQHNLGRFSMNDLDEPVELDVDILWTGGQKEIIRADPNDSQPGYSPDADLKDATLQAPLTLTNPDGVQIIFPAGYAYHNVMSSETEDRIEEEVELPRYEREAA